MMARDKNTADQGQEYSWSETRKKLARDKTQLAREKTQRARDKNTAGQGQVHSRPGTIKQLARDKNIAGQGKNTAGQEKKGLTWHRPMAHPVVFRYISYKKIAL